MNHSDDRRVFFRYEDAPLIFERPPGIRLRRLRVMKETERCLWLAEHPWQEARRILKGAKRPWASEDLEEAKRSYIARKFRQIEHCRRALDRARYRHGTACAEWNMQEEQPPDDWFGHILKPKEEPW